MATRRRKEKSHADDRDLVYRVVEEAVFAPRHLAIENDQIHRAIDKSQTWGEFKKSMPAEAYEELMTRQFDDCDERRPNSRDEFDADAIEGYLDGDYPRWLQAEMEAWIPIDLLKRYASRGSTLNGDYWAIPGALAPRLAAELRALGFKVARASKLEFV